MALADDCNVYVKSLRAGQRVLEALRRCYDRLRLQVNEAKTAVAVVWGRKFLGYCLRPGPKGQVKLAIAIQVQEKARERLRRITKRNRGRSMGQIVRELKDYVPGWKAYFQLAQTPTVLQAIDTWLRRRLRAVQLKQWKTGGLGRIGCCGVWVRPSNSPPLWRATSAAGGAAAGMSDVCLM